MPDTPPRPFHAHIYFDADQRAEAQVLRDQLAAHPDVLFAGRLVEGSVGPHPIPQFEVHFTEDKLALLRPKFEEAGLRILVHPLTDDDVADHTELGEWLGAPIDLDLTTLDPPGFNQGLARFGKTDF